MTDQDVRDFLERMAAEEPVRFLDAEPLTHRARRRAARTIFVGAVGVAAAVAVLFGGVAEIWTAPIPADQPTPTPTEEVLPSSEVLWYPSDEEGLLAVDPVTGEERVLVEDIPHFREAMLSADGRWVAYERWSGTNPSLWVVGEDLEPRKVMDLPDEGHRSWAWSSTGSQLAVDRASMLHLIDPATGLVTELASTTGVGSPPAWSPDDTRIVLGATGGTIHAFDVRTGDRWVLAELPGEDLGSVDAMAWSPDGSRLAVFSDVEPGTGRLFVLNADGSDIRVVAEEELVDPARLVPRRVSDRLRRRRSRRTVDRYLDRARGWHAGEPRRVAWILRIPGVGQPGVVADGSKIGFSVGPRGAFAIGADGSGDAVPIDDLTVRELERRFVLRGLSCWGDPGDYTGSSDTSAAAIDRRETPSRSHGRRFALAAIVTLAACAPTQRGTETAASIESSVTRYRPRRASRPRRSRSRRSPASTTTRYQREAADLQAILNDIADEPGVSATVMSADGTWSGAVGKADGVRDVTVDSTSSRSPASRSRWSQPR